MGKRDGKDKFYRFLNLDDESTKILKWYRKVHSDLMNDKYEKEIEDKNEL